MLQTLLVEFFDHHFDKLHMFQSLPDQQAMIITQAVSFTGFHNQVNLNFPAQGSAAVSASPAGPIVYRTASAGAGAPRAGGNGCYALAGNPAHPRVRAGCNDSRRLYSDVFAGLLDALRHLALTRDLSWRIPNYAEIQGVETCNCRPTLQNCYITPNLLITPSPRAHLARS